MVGGTVRGHLLGLRMRKVVIKANFRVHNREGGRPFPLVFFLYLFPS